MRAFLLPVTLLLLTNCLMAKSIDRMKVLRRAIAVAPEVDTAKATISEAAARLIAAKVTPQPELEFEVEEFAIDRPGLGDSEMTVSWSRDIEPRRRRKLRLDVARAEAKINKTQLQAELLAYLYEVTEAYFDVAARDLELQLAKEQEKLALELLNVAKKRVRAGASPGLEEERASIEHASTTIETLGAEKTLAAARARLARFLDWPTHKLKTLDTNSVDQGQVPNLTDANEKMLTQHPKLQKSQQTIFANEIASALARNESRTTWRSMAGLQHFRNNSENALVVGISVPLGTAKRNRGAILEAKAKEEMVKHERAAIIRSLERDLDVAIASAERAHSILSAIDSNILPRAESVFGAVKEGYLRGELSYADLLEARRSLVDASSKRVAALIEYRSAVVEVEKACGGNQKLHALIEEVLQ